MSNALSLDIFLAEPLDKVHNNLAENPQQFPDNGKSQVVMNLVQQLNSELRLASPDPPPHSRLKLFGSLRRPSPFFCRLEEENGKLLDRLAKALNVDASEPVESIPDE